MIDFNTLTLGEAAFIERHAGVPMAKFGDDDTPKMRMMTALVVVTKRREGDPQYSVAAAEQLTLAEANQIVGMDDDEPEEVLEAE